MKENKVQVRDGAMHCRSSGEGVPLVLLHSIGLSGEMWRHVMAPLSKKYSVYAPDLMGHGDSGKPTLHYEISDYARSVVEFMDALGLSQAAVIGNSLGALVSVEMAACFADRVLRQVLVGCPASATAWERMQAFMRFAQRYDEQGNPLPLSMAEIAKRYQRADETIRDWHNGLRARSWCHEAQIAMALYDLAPRLAMVDCPTLIMYGSDDALRRTMPVLTKGIPQSQAALVKNGNHFLPFDTPELFLEAVTKFL